MEHESGEEFVLPDQSNDIEAVRKCWKNTAAEFVEFRDSLIEMVKYLQRADRPVDPKYILGLMGNAQHTVYCAACEKEGVPFTIVVTRSLGTCMYCNKTRLCSPMRTDDGELEIACNPVCNEALLLERARRFEAECELKMEKEESAGVIRALKDQLNLVRAAADDTCIVEDELRAYLKQFVAGDIASPVSYMQSEISRLTDEIGRQGPLELKAKINSEEEYARALHSAQILVRLDPRKGSLEGRLLQELSAAIEGYENAHFPIDPPTSAEAAAFRAEQESDTSGNKNGEGNEQP